MSGPDVKLYFTSGNLSQRYHQNLTLTLTLTLTPLTLLTLLNRRTIKTHFFDE